MDNNTSNNSVLRRLALPTGLLAGGIALGALFSPIGLASAQDDDSTEPSAETAEDAERVHAHDMGSRGGRFLASQAVEELTGLDREAIREGFADGQSLADQAEAAGVSTEDLVSGLVSEATERIEAAVAEGNLTQAEADEKLADIESRVSERVTVVPDPTGRTGGRGLRSQVIEELTGLDPETIREGFANGESLADQAEAAGVSTEDLVSGLVAEATERVDAAVAEGDLTEAEADEKLADIEDRVSERVTTVPDLSERPGRRGRGPGRSGAAGEAPGTDTETSVSA